MIKRKKLTVYDYLKSKSKRQLSNLFVHTVEEYQPRHLELMAFSDHHQYSKKDIFRIQRKANIMKADIIITTQKDEQKLLLYANQLSIFVLAIEVRFLPEHGKSIKEMLNLYAQTCLPL